MAKVFATKTGNWSDTTVWNTGALPTSADNVYSNNFTVTIDQNVTVLSIGNTSATGITAGGSFFLGDNFTITCTDVTNGIQAGTVTCLTYNGTVTATINSSINGSSTTASSCVIHSGTGTLNIVGSVNGFAPSTTNCNAVFVSSTGTLNLVGNITTRGTQKQTVVLVAGSTLNMTGDCICENNAANSGVCIQATSATVNITGNLIVRNSSNSANVNWFCLYLLGSSAANVTGNITNDTTVNAMSASYPVYSVANTYFKNIGTVTAGLRAPAVYSLGASAINIMTGPFLCAPNGTVPFSVTRMHLIRTLGTYFEFRDETTNGALPPAASAPATRLVSPDTVVDAPIPANVRQGVSYALGTFTGTLAVPSPDSVAKGVPTDNTVGTAALKPEDVWNYQTTNLTTSGSIGERLKNASTVDTTGDQLAALL